MKPAVSIIIPVYNTRNYVAEALQSVLDQSLRDVEVIAVDDGSTDGSLEVLQSFGNRITVLSQKNSGQGAARNNALEIARGEFVYFMDSDDWISVDAMEKCVARCRKDNLDFVFFDAVSFGEGFDQASCSAWFDYHRSAPYTGVSDGCSVMTDMLARGLYRCSVCMCLFRLEFLKKHGLRFPTGILHEDEAFAAAAYINASRVAGIPEEFYHRRVRGNSVMTTTFSPRNVQGYLTTLELVAPLAVSGEKTRAVKMLSRSFVMSLMHNSWNLPLKLRLKIAWVILARHSYAFSLRPFLSLLFKKYFR